MQARIGHNHSLRTAFFILSARLTDTFASLSNERGDDYNPAEVIRQQMIAPSRALDLAEIAEALSWEAHAPLVDEFRVPSELIGPDVRVVTE